MNRHFSLKYSFTFACLAHTSFATASFDQMLKETLEQAREKMKMPGLRAAVRLPDGEVVKSSVGLADKEANLPLNNTIAMPGGSTGKTFVVTLSMLLVEDGVISLDDHASKYPGDREWYQRVPNADAIKVRHLLSHLAGIGDYPGTRRHTFSMVWRVIRHGSAKFTPEELIGFAHRRKPYFPVGEGFRYSDVGYLILGRVIEASTNRTYFDLLKERILNPQELDEIVNSELYGRMLEGEWRDPATPGDYCGYGLFVYADGAVFVHAGLWPGYITDVLHYVITDTTIAVQTNGDGRIDIYEAFAEIMKDIRISNSL